MDKEQVAKKTGCLNKKEDYFKCIFREVELDCWYCPIPMKDCEFWISRSKDKEKKTEGWREYLLEK